VGGAPQPPACPPTGSGAVPQGSRIRAHPQERKGGWSSTVPARSPNRGGEVPLGGGTRGHHQKIKGGWSSLVPTRPPTGGGAVPQGGRTVPQGGGTGGKKYLIQLLLWAMLCIFARQDSR
jgi:hypothetical protein